MNIGIINGDKTRYPNLALMKISAYHKMRGDSVEWAWGLKTYDKCYCSRVFTFSTHNDDLINIHNPECGGSGFDVKKRLPQEIENIKNVDYSIFPFCDFSIQYYSRGCIRSCSFCLVHDKEGYIQPIEPLDLNPKGKYIEVFDNNFFANPEWKFAIEDLMSKNQPVKFSGVDARIITDEQSYMLSKLKIHNGIHIAWDFPNVDISEGIKTLKKYNHDIACYVLVGYNSDIEQDMHRIRILLENDIRPFVMPYRDYSKNNEPKQYTKDLARWCNSVWVRKRCDFRDYQPRKGFFCREYFNKKFE